MGARPSAFRLMSEGPLRLYSTMELLNLPSPTWLIDKIIPAGGLVAIYGEPGCGKSFIALDIAFCVSTGMPWQGHPVEPGRVLYIAAEGGSGISKRVRALLLHHKTRPSQVDVAWLVESIPVHVDSDQMTILLERIETEIVDWKPDLVIIDTLARCFDGDENEQEDMGRFVAGVDHLRGQFGCTVMVIHHTRLDGSRERGNTAFRGAADAMLFIEKDGPDIRITNTKQKDAEEFKPIDLELSPIVAADSCIVIGSSAKARGEEEYAVVIETLDRLQPCKWDDWVEGTGLSSSKFFKYFPELKKKRIVVKNEQTKLWSIAGV